MTHSQDTRERPPRALHLFGALNRGGAETWLMDVMRHSNRDELHLDVCVVKEGAGAYESEFTQLGGRVLRCPLRNNAWGFARRLEKMLATESYDIVHSHLYYFSGMVLRAAARAGVAQRIAHIHPVIDLKAGSAYRRIYTRLMRSLIVRYGTHFVGPTRASLEGFWGPVWKHDENKSVLYNGIRVQRFKGQTDRTGVFAELDIPEETKMILNVARFAPHKRQALLVDVAKCLAQSEVNFCMVLIGQGEYRDDVMRMVSAAGLEPRFRFVSGAPSIDKYYLASDAFAFPSTNEGFGIAIAEAGAAGLPVVACDIPGVQEAADSCEEITMLPEDATAEQWSERLAKALTLPRESPDTRVARLDSFPFSLEASINALKNLYRVRVPLETTP